MRDAVKDDPNESYLHLDFYDRSKLIQWLRQHPSVMLWVKAKLGQGYSGWQPYGAQEQSTTRCYRHFNLSPVRNHYFTIGKGAKTQN